MKNKLFKIIFALAFLLFPFSAMSGERMPAGSVLEEESYVFSIEEGRRLMDTIKELEAEVEKQKRIVELYKDLDEVNKQKQEEMDLIISIQDQQLDIFKERSLLDAKRIDQMERQRRLNGLERAGVFGAGLATAILALYTADKLDDNVFENN